MPSGPIEKKVNAGAASGGGGIIIANALVWLLGASVWGAGFAADHVEAAYAAVPAPVTVLINVGIGSGLAWLGGYLARHTTRPDLGVR